MLLFAETFAVDSRTRILDIGGDPFNWSLLSEAEPRIVYANVYTRPGRQDWIIGDGRRLPFPSGSFDIAYSNSVIEHLGDLGNQEAFARECQRVGVRYYVQTPNRRFFVEPHLITPFIHWLPRRWQCRLLRNFTVWGLVTRPDRQACKQLLDEVHLLDEQDMRRLFPEAQIWRERFLGFTKSLIAAKG
jgi:hypothetical protein